MLSALDLARRIAAGELTAAHVVDLCAQAIARREPEIGAFATLDLAAARRAAEAAGLAQLPLAGLPVGIKDIYDTADMPTGYGSPIYAGHQPSSDAAMVMLVRRAGGVIVGKTVTAAFASREDAPTRNPLDPARTPGGSSSGSAAAVAAGMLPIALGSQTGGSTIRPAAYCGVAGYKPSFKLFPTVGMKCFSWSLDTVGLFAASVADVAFAAAAISGRDLRVDARPPSVPAIAIVRTDAWDEASEPMQSAIEHAARAAERAGATIKDLPLPAIFADASRAHRTIVGHEAYRALAYEYDRHRDRLGPLVARSNSTRLPRSPSMLTTKPGARCAVRVNRLSISARRHRDPDAVRPRRCATGVGFRRTDLQPPLDPARHAVRQRPRIAGYGRPAARRADRRPVRTRPFRTGQRGVHGSGSGRMRRRS